MSSAYPIQAFQFDIMHLSADIFYSLHFSALYHLAIDQIAQVLFDQLKNYVELNACSFFNFTDLLLLLLSYIYKI